MAGGDVTGDKVADIVVGAASGSPGGHVKVFDGVTGQEVRSFLAFPGFIGGVNVAAGDLNGDGRAEVMVGVDSGTTPHVKVFDGLTSAERASFFAFGGSIGTVRVAADDFDGDGLADIVVGAGPGAGPQVRVLDGQTLAELANFFAFDPPTLTGVFVG